VDAEVGQSRAGAGPRGCGSARPWLCLGCAGHPREGHELQWPQGRKGVLGPTASSFLGWGDPVPRVPGAFRGLVCGVPTGVAQAGAGRKGTQCCGFEPTSGGHLPAPSWYTGRLGREFHCCGDSRASKGSWAGGSRARTWALGPPGCRGAAEGSVDVPSCSGSSALRMAWPGRGPGCSCWVAGPGEAGPSTLGSVSTQEGRRGLGARDTSSRPRGFVGNSSGPAAERQSASASPAGWGPACACGSLHVHPGLPLTTALQVLMPSRYSERPDARPRPGFPKVGAEEERDRDEEESPGGSVPCVLPQEGESGGDGALSPPGGGRSHLSFRAGPWRIEGV